MSLFARPAEKRTASFTSLQSIIDRGLFPGRRGFTGSVSDEKALQLSAVWACVRLISDKLSGLPVDVYRRQSDRRVEIDPQPPVVSSPSALVSRSTWVYQQLVSLLFRGNAFGVVTQMGPDGWPAKVEMTHPDCWEVDQPDQLAPPMYRFEGRPIDRSLVYHVSAYNVPGSVVGLSPITYASRSLRLALAVDDYGAEILLEGGHPTSVLTSDQKIDADSAKLIKARFKDATREDHFAVLGAGLKYAAVQLTPADVQFLETRQASVIDICRYFGCPPEAIYAAVSGQSITYANREQKALDLLADSLQPWMTRLEEAWSAILPRGQYVKFNEKALLRTDALTQSTVIDRAIRNGIRSRDEARQLEDLPPIPDGTGGEFLWPPYRSTPLPEEGGTPNA